MLHICPRLPHQPFVEPPFEEEILAFLWFRGHSGAIRRLTDVNINKLHQPCRSFASIINKCLTGKSLGYDSLRLFQAQILWGLYHKRNVDFAYLMWEDFVYQVEHKDIKKNNEMYYPRDDHIFSTIKLVSRHQNTQQFGLRLTTSEKGKQAAKASKAKNEATGTLLRVPDVPTDESEEEISWNSTNEVGDDDEGKDDDGDDGEEGDGDDDDNEQDDDERNDEDDEEEGSDGEQASDEEEFIHPSLSTHAEEETRDEESFDPIPKTPKNSDDEGNGEENIRTNVGRDEGQDAEDEADELYRDVNINLGRGIQLGDVHTTQEVEESYVTLTPSDQLRDKAQPENDEFLKTIDENMQKIIKEQVKEQVKVQVSKILPTIEQTVNEQLEAEVLTQSSNSSKTSYAIAADLSEMRNLYKALVEAYKSDKIILDTYEDTVTLKRRRDDDADKDKEPFAGSDRGSKRRREGKEPESASAPTEKATRSAGADDQPIVQSSQHPEWFSQQQKPLTLDCDWNKTLPATHGSIQPWISELAKQSDSRSSFNEFMDTPGISHWGRKRQQFYCFAINRESARDVYSKRRIIAVTELKIVEWHNYKHLDWITVRRDDDKLYKFKEGDFKRLRIQDIEDIIIIQRRVEDLQLGVESYQKKLNLTKPDTYRSDVKRKEAYIAYSNPRGFIYQNKDKQNRLMRIDELHKLSDGMLTDVRTALDDRLKGIWIKYLPQSIGRKSDKDRAAAMIQAIDKRLKTRRIIRSLDRFVGGRLYEGDFRMLQRTI
nr:hypothetical protein [Tanacetum cinerariifolium]